MLKSIVINNLLIDTRPLSLGLQIRGSNETIVNIKTAPPLIEINNLHVIGNIIINGNLTVDTLTTGPVPCLTNKIETIVLVESEGP